MRLRIVALTLRSPVPRVWLPSLRCQPLNPLEASLSPQHSWALPSRAFLLTHDQGSLPKTSLRPCTSLENLPAFYRCSNGFIPQVKPCLLLPPEGLARVETSCSPGLATSQALPPTGLEKELLPLFLPLSSFLPTLSQA